MDRFNRFKEMFIRENIIMSVLLTSQGFFAHASSSFGFKSREMKLSPTRQV